MTDKIIPITPLYERYRTLRPANQAKRLTYVRAVLANPSWLAEEFVTTVALFRAYDNADQPFYDKRPEHQFGPALQATKDVVLRLEKVGRVEPTDADDRLTGPSDHPDILNVAAADLAFEYVDREILLQRTLSPASWDNGAPTGGGIRPDILLANAQDRTPIVAELKLPGDMDPFFAFIQALAGAAHLATPHQYQRLRNHLKSGKFPPLAAAPRLDIYTLFVGTTEGSNQPEFSTAAQTLPPLLLRHDGLAQSIRRIAGISISLADDETVKAEVRFAWQRQIITPT